MKTLIIAGLSVASLSIMSLYAWRYKNKAFKRRKTHRVEISIHNSVIGCVIGRGGDNLKRIESKSGAKIKFYSGGFSSEYSLFVVKGDQNQVSLAEIMIAQVLKETLNELNASSLSQSSDYEFLSQFSKNLDDRLDKSVVADDSRADFNVSDLKEELINFAVGHTQKLYSVSDDGFIPVYVSAVATPHIFWVQAIRTKEHIELDRLTEELAEYYKAHPELDVPLNYSSVKVGLICATYFEQDKRWYRAEISEVLSVNEQDVNETTIDLYFLDYGESSYQKIKNIRAIPSEFLELKFQAIECSLSNIKPIGETWTEESVSFFEEITHVGQWYTMLARIDDENDGHRPGLTLIDTTSEKIWFIFVLVLCISMSFARSRYLTIPWDNVQIMDIAERDDLGHQQIPLPRQRRHVISNKSSKFGGYHQGQPFAEASSQFEQANFNPHEYVDYGAHTGHHGAFGWYADFPVHQNH